MICVFICCNSCDLFLELLMKVMYAVKRLKLLHLITFVFINFFTRLQLCCFARV